MTQKRVAARASRRKFLTVAGAGGVTALTGCLSGGSGSASGGSGSDGQSGGNDNSDGTTAGDSTGGGGETLELWVFGGQSASKYDKRRQEFISQWESDTGNTVETTRIPFGQMLDKIQTSMRAGQGPDITQSTVVWTPLLASNGWLAPLSDRIQDAPFGEDDFFPQIWRAANIDDQMYGVPINVGSWGLWYYNADKLEQAGYDPMNPDYMQTWDDVIGVASDVKEATGDPPIGICGADKAGLSVQYTGLFCTTGNNSWLTDDQSDTRLDKEPGLRTARYYQRLTENGLIPEGSANNDQNAQRQLFLNGKTAMYQVGSWERDIIKEKSDVNFGITYLPMASGGRHSMFQGGFHWAVNESSSKKDAAWELITSLTKPEVQLQIDSLPPALVEATEERFSGWKDGLGRDVGQVQIDQLQNAGGFPVHPKTAAMNQTYRPQLQQIILQNKSAEEAMTKAADTIRSKYL